jgi:hypothetical protein
LVLYLAGGKVRGEKLCDKKKKFVQILLAKLLSVVKRYSRLVIFRLLGLKSVELGPVFLKPTCKTKGAGLRRRMDAEFAVAKI